MERLNILKNTLNQNRFKPANHEIAIKVYDCLYELAEALTSGDFNILEYRFTAFDAVAAEINDYEQEQVKIHDELEEEVEELKNTIDNLENTIDELEEEIYKLENTIDNLDEEVDELKIKIDTLS